MEELNQIIAEHETREKVKAEESLARVKQVQNAKVAAFNHVTGVALNYLTTVRIELKKKNYFCEVKHQNPQQSVEFHFNDKRNQDLAPILAFGDGGQGRIIVTYAKRKSNTVVEPTVKVVGRCSHQDFTEETVKREVANYVKWVLANKSILDVNEV